VIAARWPIAGSAHSPDVEASRHVAVMRCMTCVAGHHQHVIGVRLSWRDAGSSGGFGDLAVGVA
jgi:hypothetical protein